MRSGVIFTIILSIFIFFSCKQRRKSEIKGNSSKTIDYQGKQLRKTNEINVLGYKIGDHYDVTSRFIKTPVGDAIECSLGKITRLVFTQNKRDKYVAYYFRKRHLYGLLPVEKPQETCPAKYSQLIHQTEAKKLHLVLPSKAEFSQIKMLVEHLNKSFTLINYSDQVILDHKSKRFQRYGYKKAFINPCFKKEGDPTGDYLAFYYFSDHWFPIGILPNGDETTYRKWYLKQKGSFSHSLYKRCFR